MKSLKRENKYSIYLQTWFGENNAMDWIKFLQIQRSQCLKCFSYLMLPTQTTF